MFMPIEDTALWIHFFGLKT